VPPKRRFTYGLHDAISEKTATFTTAAVRTSVRSWVPCHHGEVCAAWLSPGIAAATYLRRRRDSLSGITV
jgi:hypothetical protein